MAKLTQEDVLKLAKLARLDLSPGEAKQFGEEMNEILGYVEQLQTVELNSEQPTYQVTGLTNVTRPDETLQYQAAPQDLLKNVPSVESGQIKVKRVL